jgi:hypothetical protein
LLVILGHALLLFVLKRFICLGVGSIKCWCELSANARTRTKSKRMFVKIGGVKLGGFKDTNPNRTDQLALVVLVLLVRHGNFR